MIQEARRWTASILFSLEPGSALTTCSWLLTSWLHTRLQHPRLSSRKGEISGSHQKPGLLLNLLDSENNWPAFTSYSPTMVNSKGIYQTRYSHKAWKKKKKHVEIIHLYICTVFSSKDQRGHSSSRAFVLLCLPDCLPLPWLSLAWHYSVTLSTKSRKCSVVHHLVGWF